MSKTPVWQRKAGQNTEGGLNEAGRRSLKAEGHDIKRPQPEGGSRRDSFCARMKGMKAKLTSSETANDPDSRINKSLRKWNCADGGAVDPYDSVQQAAKGGKVWDKPRPKKLGKPEPLSSKEKSSAKAAAKAAGRPYPNLIDNMRAARADGGATYPLANRDEWTAAKHYEDHGGRMEHMSPEQFLSRTRHLDMDDKTQRSIDAYKGQIASGHRMNPLQLLANGLEDGRHRATAAKELGVRSVPVVDFRADGGEVEGDVQFAPDDPYAKVQEAAKLPMMAQHEYAMRMPEPEVRYDTGPQPGEATLKAYDPTIKERIYQGIAGTEERPSPERAQFARGMSQMAEFAPVLGNVMASQEAQRRGDTKGMLMAALPVPGMATEARMAEAAAGPAQQAAQEAYQRVLNAQGLYSHAAEAAANLPQAKGSYEQMMAMLQKAGVKPEEMRWSGVEQFAGQPVTREQLASHFEQNVPKIEETILGAPDETKLNEADAAVRDAIRAYNEGQVAPRYYAHNPERSYASSFFPTQEEAAAHIATLPENYRAGTTVMTQEPKPLDVYETMRRLHGGEFIYNMPPKVERAALNLMNERQALQEAAEGTTPKFEQYTIPGGQNYREVLLHTPGQKQDLYKQISQAREDRIAAVREHGSVLKYDDPALEQERLQKIREATKRENDLRNQLENIPPEFTSSHWDQPNVLGHLRLSDRTGPQGEKILHMEELQSDWGQAGRKQGFGSKKLSPDEEAEYFKLYGMMGSDRNEAQQARLDELVDKMNKASRSVPAAPYVEKTQNWVDLGLKRALKEAAEKGYDKLVWTPGAEQAARYDLSKQISHIQYNPETGMLVAADKRGTPVVKQEVHRDRLPEFIGKDAAERLLKNKMEDLPVYELKGDDLQFGGHGMKSFYDTIVPTQLQKLVKKLDPQAKIELGGHSLLRDGEEVRAHSIQITPQMRKAILKGLPAYADGGAVPEEPKQDPYEAVQQAANTKKEYAPFNVLPLREDESGIHFDPNAGVMGGMKRAGEYFYDTMSGRKEMNPTSPEAIEAASNIAGMTTLGAGAFERPAGSLAMGASRVKDPFPYLSGMDIPGAYGSAVGSPFHPDPVMREEALKMGQKYLVPMEGRYVGQPGSYYSTAQPIAPLDVRPTIIGSPRSVGKGEITLQPTNEMTWEQFAKQGKGGTLINLAGDRMNFGRLTHINDQPLAWPVDLHAGPKYMREPNPGEVWANDPNAATGIRKAIASASEKGPVYGVYTPMGAQSVNSSHNMFESVMAQIPNAGISKSDMKDFDKAIKSGKQVIGNTPKDVGKRNKAIELLKNWPGIANAKEAAEFARTLPGVHRADIINMLEKGEWRDKGFPNIGVTRVAITDPQFLRTPNNMIGGRMVELTGSKPTKAAKQFTHASYPVETYGKYIGDVPMLQRQYTMPEVMKRYVNPTATGTVVHPYSTQNLGRASFRKLFETNVHQQPINQEFIDSVMLGLERQKEYGFKKGGKVVNKADQYDNIQEAAKISPRARRDSH